MNRATWLQGRRMLKFRDVLSRWERRELSMMEAGELLGMSERQFRRYRDRFEDDGEAGLIDRRLGKPSPRRIEGGEVDRMLELYRTHYRGWNVKHFHEQGVRDHKFGWGYTWTKTQLHAAGLVERVKRRGAHRRKRERKPCEGMMLHQDGSRAAWLSGQPALDLIVTMDDATSTIYSAFLVEEEGTASTFRALLEVFTAHGLPSSLYTDRGSHYFYTAKAGEAVDREHLTQVGRALERLGIEHIAALRGPVPGRSGLRAIPKKYTLMQCARAALRDAAAASAVHQALVAFRDSRAIGFVVADLARIGTIVPGTIVLVVVCLIGHELDRGHGDQCASRTPCWQNDARRTGRSGRAKRPLSRFHRTRQSFRYHHRTGTARPGIGHRSMRIDPGQATQA